MKPFLNRALAVLASALVLTACGGSDPQTDISIAGTGPGQPVAPGSVAEFRMRVANAGPADAEDLLVTNAVDSRLTLLEIGCEAEGAARCPASPSAGMTLDRLPAGSALTFVVRALVPTSVPGGLVLNQMSTRRVPGDPDLSNNSSTATAVVANAQLSVGYTVDGTGAAGNDVLFLATVSNLGPGSASDVQLAIADPAGLTPLALSCAAFDGATCPVDLAARPLVARQMPAGSRLRLQIPYATAPTLRGDFSGSFSATTPSDPSPDNNSASATIRLVAPTARLAVTHAVAAVTSAGTTATFRVSVVNRSPNTSFALNLQQRLPAGLGTSDWTCTPSIGASCPATLGPAMTLASLPGGASLSFTYAVALPLALAGSDVTARFEATAEGVPLDADNAADATTSVRQPQADLQLRQTVPAQVAAGAPVLFSATVTNLGPDTARGATLTHAVSGSVVAGSLRYGCVAAGGATCPALPGATQALADLPVGSSVRLLVEATAGAAGGSLVGQAQVQMAGDPQAGNDSDQDAVSIVPPPARLSAAMSAPGTAPTSGLAAFTARITNGGPETATQVRIDFSATGLAGTPGVSCTASVGAACPATLGASTRADSLAAGAWLQLRYELPVPAGATPGTVVTAEVAASADGDPATGDNLATARTTIVAAPADLQLSASLAPSLPQGEPKTVVVVVTNGGPSEALGATLHYVPGLSTVPLTVQCSASRGATCPTSLADPTALVIDSLPVAGSLRLSYVQATDSVAQGSTLVDTVSVRYAGDPDPANDESAVSTTITARADARNGDYRMYGAEGRQRTLRLDFDRREMTVDGVVRPFDAPDADGVHAAGAGRRFRIADGLVVGLDDAGGTLLPYVAARSFVTDLSRLGDGSDMVLMGRSVEPAGASSRYAGARLGSGTLQICGASTPLRIAACPANAISSYRLALRANSDVIDATDTAGSGQVLSFRVAQIGSEWILMRAGASVDGTSRLMQLGLVARTPADADYLGGTSTGDWGSSRFAPGSAQLAFDGATDDLVTLSADTTGWPQGLLGGLRGSDGASTFVFGSSHLLVTVVARGAPATGFVSIGLTR